MKILTIFALCATLFFFAAWGNNKPDARDRFVGTWSGQIIIKSVNGSANRTVASAIGIVKIDTTINKIKIIDHLSNNSSVQTSGTVNGNSATFDVPTTDEPILTTLTTLNQKTLRLDANLTADIDGKTLKAKGTIKSPGSSNGVVFECTWTKNLGY